MINDIIFKTKASFISVNYDKDCDRWNFLFEDNLQVSSSGFWRILENNKIVIISSDHGQQFGLLKPLELVEEFIKLFSGKTLIQIQVKNNTADLTLSITHNIEIQIFISSTGFETYEFLFNNKRYIGLGGGNIAILDNF